MLEAKLGLDSVVKVDEMTAMMNGLGFLIENSSSVFRYDQSTRQRIPVTLSPPLYPFLLINIGSGVSIIKAIAPGHFVRVTGTCVGGGTVLGLARFLCGARSFDEILEWADEGEDCLDLKVEDLLGDAAGSRCLPPDTFASSFGRIYSRNLSRENVRKEDIARSLVHMVSYNIGYIAYLVGVMHGIKRFFFSGKFVNNRGLTMESITHGVMFYLQHYRNSARGRHVTHNSCCSVVGEQRNPTECDSLPSFEVLFLKHDGYLGALGSLLSDGG